MFVTIIVNKNCGLVNVEEAYYGRCSLCWSTCLRHLRVRYYMCMYFVPRETPGTHMEIYICISVFKNCNVVYDCVLHILAQNSRTKISSFVSEHF